MPGDGTYCVPGGIVPVTVKGGMARYVEPNVWVEHPV
jgi:hypothetical protein